MSQFARVHMVFQDTHIQTNITVTTQYMRSEKFETYCDNLQH